MKGAVDAGVPIKIKLGVPSGDGHGTVTVLDEWMGNRARLTQGHKLGHEAP